MIKKLDRITRSLLIKCLSPLRAVGIEVPTFFAKHLHYKGVVKVSLDGPRFFKMKSYGHAIENRLYWYGKHGHEPETFLPWLKAANNSSVILDIGANTALFSLGAAGQNKSAQIFAFEPLPRVANLARHNVSLNEGFNITICENAVCDVSGSVTLHDPGGDQPASASLRSDFLDGEKAAIKVDAIRIDDFVQAQGLKSVDLVKLDVEGIEELALRGMRQTIEQFKPVLFIEVLDGRVELMEEIQTLLDIGYQVGDLTDQGIVPIDFQNAKGQDRNLLLSTNLSFFTQ